MEFLNSSKEISEKIRRLREYTDKLQQYTLTKQNSVLSSAEESALDSKIDTVNDLFTNTSSEVKEMVHKNQRKIIHLVNEHAPENTIELMKLHTFRHARDLSDAVRGYQNIQHDYKERERATLRETYLVANPQASDQDLERLTSTDEGESLLASSFALGSHTARGMLSEAKNRKQKIDRIVQLITTLVQLIEDLDTMVRDQASVTDNIATHMSIAEEHTTQTNKELTSALKYEKRAMRIKRILFFIFIIIIVAGLFWLGSWLWNVLPGAKNKNDNNNNNNNKNNNG